MKWNSRQRCQVFFVRSRISLTPCARQRTQKNALGCRHGQSIRYFGSSVFVFTSQVLLAATHWHFLWSANEDGKEENKWERGTSSLTQQAMKRTLLVRTLAAHNGIIPEDKTTRRSTLFTEAHRKSVCFYWLASFLDKFDLFCRRDLTRFQMRKQRKSTSLSMTPMENVPVN